MGSANDQSIKVVDCQILAHDKFAGGQYILTLASKTIAQTTKPGQFVHVSVCENLLMRRPFSVMLVDVSNASFDLFYKIVGEGTRQLAMRKIGETLSVIGPIGNGFSFSDKKRPLLIGGGVGMPPMIAIAQKIRHSAYSPFVILGSELAFPFAPKLSKIGKPFVQTSHTMPLLEEWGVPCRLASLGGFEGVFKGLVTELARVYLESLAADELAQVEVYACGPVPMLVAVADLAKDYNLPCQVSLEENMACAVGGCAGCTVRVETDSGSAMRRVCVDGPVFDATQVF